MANDGAISDRAVSLEIRAAVLLPRVVVATPSRSLVSLATDDDFDVARDRIESTADGEGWSDSRYEIELAAEAERVAEERLSVRVPMDHEERAERGFEAAR